MNLLCDQQRKRRKSTKPSQQQTLLILLRRILMDDKIVLLLTDFRSINLYKQISACECVGGGQDFGIRGVPVSGFCLSEYV